MKPVTWWENGCKNGRREITSQVRCFRSEGMGRRRKEFPRFAREWRMEWKKVRLTAPFLFAFMTPRSHFSRSITSGSVQRWTGQVWAWRRACNSRTCRKQYHCMPEISFLQIADTLKQCEIILGTKEHISAILLETLLSLTDGCSSMWWLETGPAKYGKPTWLSHKISIVTWSLLYRAEWWVYTQTNVPCTWWKKCRDRSYYKVVTSALAKFLTLTWIARPWTLTNPDKIQQRRRSAFLMFKGLYYQRLVLTQRRALRNIWRTQWICMDGGCGWHVCSFFLYIAILMADSSAETKYLISGAADNTLKLWLVQTGKCLYTWEFPTAVKRVAFNEEGDQVVCITEQRMGFQCAIRVFKINREDGMKRTLYLLSDHLRPH